MPAAADLLRYDEAIPTARVDDPSKPPASRESSAPQNSSVVKARPQTILGHRIAEPRPTATAIRLLLTHLLLPVLLAGMLLDYGIQRLFGWCVGLWCLAG